MTDREKKLWLLYQSYKKEINDYNTTFLEFRCLFYFLTTYLFPRFVKIFIKALKKKLEE